MATHSHGARRAALLASIVALALALAIPLMFGGQSALAAAAPVGLGTAGSFAVLAGSAVTNTGPSVVNGNVGVSPGTSITGFPPGISGTRHSANATAQGAQDDLTIAYNDAAGRAGGATISGNLGGQELVGGVYKSGSTMGLTGVLTLNGENDPNAVWIFQVGSALDVASGSSVALINQARSCNVFWQVGSSATLGTGSSFSGNILALTSITANTDAIVSGRLLARNGAVTLDTNTITPTSCAAAAPSPSPVDASPSPDASPTPDASPSPAASPSPSTSMTPSPTPSGSTSPTPTPSSEPTATETVAPAASPLPSPAPSPTPAAPAAAPAGGDAGSPTPAANPASNNPNNANNPEGRSNSNGAETGNAAAASARRVNSGSGAGGAQSQVTLTPTGGVHAGGGSTAGIENLPLVALGIALLGASGITLVYRRRLPVQA